MKFILLTFALIGFVAAAQLPDSATQGPNPQDIATPEPEYIDIDEPLPPQAPAPVLQGRSSNFAAAPQPLQRPVAQPQYHFAQSQAQFQYAQPQSQYIPPQQQQLVGHSFNSQTGYQYRHPVYYRRVYRRLY